MNPIGKPNKKKCYRCESLEHDSRSCDPKKRKPVYDSRNRFGSKPHLELAIRASVFAETLKQDPKTRSEAGQIIDKLYRGLQSHRNLSVDHLAVAGSVGKKTALAGSDFDLVVFLNKELPPFTTILPEIRSMISGLFKIPINEITQTRYSVQFAVGGIEFDLLPAVNTRTENLTKPKQMKRVLNYYNGYGYGPFNHLFGSSLTEFASHFVSKRTPVMLTTIRLAKYWNTMVDIGNQYISGRSAMIELVVLGCNIGKKQRRVLTCFTRFLLGMAKLKSLVFISFEYYGRNQVPEAIMSQRPLILDPSNPMNNFGHIFINDDGLLQVFEDAARRTLEKIRNPNQNEIPEFLDPGN